MDRRSKEAERRKRILDHAKTKNNWLGRQDLNLGMAELKSAALPLGYAPVRRCSIPLRFGGAEHSEVDRVDQRVVS